VRDNILLLLEGGALRDAAARPVPASLGVDYWYDFDIFMSRGGQPANRAIVAKYQ